MTNVVQIRKNRSAEIFEVGFAFLFISIAAFNKYFQVISDVNRL